MRFRYRLEGFEDNWNEITEPRKAIYPRLSAGNYRFRVMGASSDGTWNEHGASIYLAIAPFFWQTWWFLSLGAILFAGITLLGVRYISFRCLRRKLQILEQRSALDRERARIARDIHDDLGHGLTQIVLLSDMTKNEQAEELDAHLEQIAATARQGIKSLDETVWAINPRNDTLVDLVDYVGHFALQSFRAAGIKCHLELPDKSPEQPIPSEARHAIFLVVKEAINNILRHAYANEVRLIITHSWDALQLRISDNGRGFSAAPDDPCQDGLRNMRQRMTDIGGTFNVESTLGYGTTLMLSYHWRISSNGVVPLAQH